MLEEYAKKRNFGKTPEPTDDPFVDRSGPLRFVVQKHDATRLHYDFRLELDGTLKSWAVPKGVSLNPADKRLAVHVEDHPISYGRFEGAIPKGEYGAGEVIVWDEGVYFPEEGNVSFDDREGAEKRLLKEYKEGKMKIVLRGQKLKGSWALVRSSRNPKEWLLIKHRDAFATEDDVLLQDRSVVSGRTIEDIRNGVQGQDVATWTREGEFSAALTDMAELKGAKEAPIPKTFAPMMASEVEKPFSNPNFSFELKLDGVRLIVIRSKQGVKLLSRNLNDVTSRFPKFVEEIKSIPAEEFILDGEIVHFDENGKPSFQGLMERFALTNEHDQKAWDARLRLDFVVFDLVYLNGWDLKGVAYEKRRELLEQLNPTTDMIRILDAYPEVGDVLFEQAQALGLEGVIGKKLTSVYRPGDRSKDWLKVKGYHTEDFYVCGYLEGSGARSTTFGSLIIGQIEDGKMVFCGAVGTGFNDQQLDEICAMLQPIITKKAPFEKLPQIPGKKTWVEPIYVVEVKFMTRTREKNVRFPVFVRMRPDLSIPENSPFTEPMTEPAGDTESILEALQETKKELEVNVDGIPVRFTSLDRALWPATDNHPAVTKRDLATYYAKVADFMLPHLRDRPLSFVRFPDGIGGESFFQKHWDKGRPDFVETVKIWSEHNTESLDWILCNNKPSLLWLTQMSSLEIHSWYSRCSTEKSAATQSLDFHTSKETLENSILQYPDFMVFDLDPVQKDSKGKFNKELFARTSNVALGLKEILDSLGLKGYLKTSGKSGLHIYIPLKRIYDYDEVRAMAETFGRHVMQMKPEDVTMEWQVKKRPDKIFFDHNQNVRGKTLISIYSTRPAPGATVSFPIKWEDLPDVDPRDFTIFNVPDILEKQGDIWSDILKHKQVLA
jgi:bifunctional non-homologous end joining protein LigD